MARALESAFDEMFAEAAATGDANTLAGLRAIGYQGNATLAHSPPATTQPATPDRPELSVIQGGASRDRHSRPIPLSGFSI